MGEHLLILAGPGTPGPPGEGQLDRFGTVFVANVSVLREDPCQF